MKRLIAAMLFLAMLLCTAGCHAAKETPGLTDEEAEQILAALLPKSGPLMHVFFGEGLAYDPPETTIEYDGVQYEPVKEGEMFSSLAQMREALAGVFTTDYASDLSILMFDGYEPPEEIPEDEEVFPDSIRPRYRETNGVLEIDIKYEGFTIRQIPIATGAKVIRGNATRVVVELAYPSGGTTRANLALENGVWLLDGPTY